MTQYVPQVQTGMFLLEAGQSYDLQFLLPNLGTIAIVGAGTVLGTQPEGAVARRIDLFSPVSGFNPVATRIDDPPQASQTTLYFEAISGVSGWWMARIRNVSKHMAHCSLTVTYPGRVERVEMGNREVPRALLNPVLNQMDKGEVYITKGR